MKLPLSGITKLSKSFLEIRGPDSAKFLNGLVTSRFLPNVVKKNQYTINDLEFRHDYLNKVIHLSQNWGTFHEDIYDPENNITIGRDGINSLFMNSKGRVIADCFIYNNPLVSDGLNIEPNYVIEVNQPVVSKLKMLLGLHKLQAKIKFSDEDGYRTYYYYNDSVEFDEFLEGIQEAYFRTNTPQEALDSCLKFFGDESIFNNSALKSIVGFAIDNRIPNFGIKVVTNDSVDKIELLFSDSFKAQFDMSQVSEETLDDRRYLNGLFESQDAPSDYQLLPFDMNLDYINGLSLDKGCYVGQELTTRTYNSGLIRKRIVPVQFFHLLGEMPHDDNYLDLSDNDAIINDLTQLNHANLNKLQVHALFESEAESNKDQENSSSPFGSSPFASSKPVRKRNTSVGKIITINKNLGFMQINLSEIDNRFFKVEVPDLDNGTRAIGIKAVRPDWWPE